MLITGASSGIGESIIDVHCIRRIKSIIFDNFKWYLEIGAHAAEHLAKKGASVCIVGRNAERLNEVGDRIKKDTSSPAPLVIVADVSTEAERIITETIKHFGKLDVLINNAGILIRDTIETVELAEYERIMKTNVTSVIELSKLAVPYLEKTKGNILNVSSSAGLRVKPNLFSYCISKYACNAITKSAALDLAPKGIRGEWRWNWKI